MTSVAQSTTILITGADRGLGFEVVKKLVENSSDANQMTILVGCRDLDRGQEALEQLGSPTNVHLLQLDVSSEQSITQAVDEIKKKYNGQLDILINNAGISKAGINIDVARETFTTNYFGVRMVNEHMYPLLRQNGRVINVASEVGAWTLDEMSSELQRQYSSSSLTIEELDRLVKNFLSNIEQQKLDASGYHTKSLYVVYGTSKAAVIALTRILARQWSASKNLLVLAVCPGYCSTDINHHDPNARPVALGAESILYPVNTPRNELENGAFYQDGQKKPQAFPCTMDLAVVNKNYE